MARVIQRHEGYVYSVCSTPDGKHVVSGSDDGTIRVTRIEDGELVRVIREHTLDVASVCVTPDGKYIVSGSYDRTIRITVNPVYLQQLHVFKRVFGQMALQSRFFLHDFENYFRENPGMFRVLGPRVFSLLV